MQTKFARHSVEKIEFFYSQEEFLSEKFREIKCFALNHSDT